MAGLVAFPDNELRAATTNINDQHTALDTPDTVGDTQVNQTRLLLPANNFNPVAHCLLCPTHEFSRVTGTTQRIGANDTHLCSGNIPQPFTESRQTL